MRLLLFSMGMRFIFAINRLPEVFDGAIAGYVLLAEPLSTV